MLNYFGKRVEILLLIGIVLTILSPWIFTRSLGFINFHDTGDIGSTIGGITAPITSLIGALLIYYALVAQRQANKIQSENNSIQTLLTLILDLENKCSNLIFIDEKLNQRKGIAAFNSTSSILYYDQIKPYMGEKTDRYKNDLMVVINFGNYFNVISNAALIYDFIVLSEIDKTNKHILQKRFEQIYIVYLNKSLRRLDEYYTEDKQNDKIKYDKYFEEILMFRNKMISPIL
ncbi:MAG TPA: hypothetical protein DHV48_06075 [Prolixibacteraceae bacterium]|nr:hypothetical protein [Prolixibacteraceae bacterium]